MGERKKRRRQRKKTVLLLAEWFVLGGRNTLIEAIVCFFLLPQQNCDYFGTVVVVGIKLSVTL